MSCDQFFFVKIYFSNLQRSKKINEKIVFSTLKGRDPQNVPCSAEHSGEGSVIFSEFIVPLFKGGTGKVWGTFNFPIFQLYQAKKIYSINSRKYN